MPNLIKKTKIKPEGRQPFVPKGGVWLMCLHLTLPSSSAATGGCPAKGGKADHEVQRAWKRRTENNTQHPGSRNFPFLRQRGSGNSCSLCTQTCFET